MWRSTLPISAGDPVELTVAASFARQEKRVVLMLNGTPSIANAIFSGSGFYWSDGLQSHYVYLPAGDGGASFELSFHCDVSSLTVAPLRLLGRVPLGNPEFQGMMLTKLATGEDSMATAWLMQYVGAAA